MRNTIELSPIPETIHDTIAMAHDRLSHIKGMRCELREQQSKLTDQLARIDRELARLHKREAVFTRVIGSAREEARERAALASGPTYNTQFEG